MRFVFGLVSKMFECRCNKWTNQMFLLVSISSQTFFENKFLRFVLRTQWVDLTHSRIADDAYGAHQHWNRAQQCNLVVHVSRLWNAHFSLCSIWPSHSMNTQTSKHKPAQAQRIQLNGWLCVCVCVHAFQLLHLLAFDLNYLPLPSNYLKTAVLFRIVFRHIWHDPMSDNRAPVSVSNGAAVPT